MDNAWLSEVNCHVPTVETMHDRMTHIIIPDLYNYYFLKGR